MKNLHVKSLKEYEDSSEFDEEKLLEAAKRLKSKRKLPTSIALEQEQIDDLKAIAAHKGAPYQVLMRMYVAEGIRRDKQALPRKPAKKAS
jgi:predicted DNA binding CopG/RHH family protein